MADITGTPGNDTLIGTPDDDFIAAEGGDDTISGLDGNDSILGGDGDDTIDGGAGHDFIRGDGGDDTLLGNSGDDYLRGGLGNDFLAGGTGWDRVAFVGAASGIIVDLGIQGVAQDTGQGLDTLNEIEHASGTPFNDQFFGNDGDNWLWGEGGNDTFDAGAGNDLVEVGIGNVVADGGSGIDTFSVWANGSPPGTIITVSLALQGSAQATGIGSAILSGFENLSGSVGNDILIGDGGANVLAGDLGSDMLRGGAGDDTLYGDGRIMVDFHDTGTSGPITIFADASVAPFPETPGDDILEGGDGDDVLNGGGGSDSASYASATGEVQVALDLGVATGAAGDDTLISIENFLGSAFNDFARGDSGANILAGFGGHDLLRGLLGADTLKGGDGDDYVDGGPGDDILDGGAGFDRVAFRTDVTAAVSVDLNIQGVAQATGQGMDTLVGIEHASGTVFGDTLTGNSGDNWLWGESGNDIVSGGGGNDLIQVGAGDATAAGGLGVDTLSFGGDELISLISPAGVSVSLLLQGAGQATEQGSMTLSGFENLSGSNFDDNLIGDDGNNLLAGDSGADTLTGGRGNDILLGDGRVAVDSHGAGTSGPIVTFDDVGLATFPSPVGNDTLDGGRGDDILNGGGGDDILTGGQGLDTFLFGSSSGDDSITDFANGQDHIAFQGIAGVDDFSDLTITRFHSGSLISWGDGTNTIFVEHVRPGELDPGDFQFI